MLSPTVISLTSPHAILSMTSLILPPLRPPSSPPLGPLTMIHSMTPLSLPFFDCPPTIHSMTPPTPLPFFSFRRNMQLWKATLDNAPNFPSLDDQTVFWTTVRQSTQVPLSTP